MILAAASKVMVQSQHVPPSTIQKNLTKPTLSLASFPLHNKPGFNSNATTTHRNTKSPVYTLGTASSEKYLNFDIKNPPFQIYRTERGGEVTYHGPGQLVMYPIINLRNHKMDLHWYLRALEEVVIRVLFSTFSLKASRVEGFNWGLGNQKLAAIGIRASQWITYHGLALNVTTDLSPFSWIVPCGIQDRQVGSIKRLLKIDQSSNGCRETNLDHPDNCQLIDITNNSLIKEFSEVFQVEVIKKNVLFSEISENF
ncbi:hypothetical protein Patl1_09099 [Pistacia atlantica]|uniref:Uncharacterized protein n=1 Tax=Pistacia atlantica TaxID=434234 RepID=A0ACC1AH41_9ROSI|nr:hypothetical protein Patl1_09099 [Pistacia atlantica]